MQCVCVCMHCTLLWKGNPQPHSPKSHEMLLALPARVGVVSKHNDAFVATVGANGCEAVLGAQGRICSFPEDAQHPFCRGAAEGALCTQPGWVLLLFAPLGAALVPLLVVGGCRGEAVVHLTVLAPGAVLGVLAAPSGHHIPASSVSAQVKGSQDGTGPSCVTPRAAGSAAGPQAPLEMNLCWNEIKKKSHSLR